MPGVVNHFLTFILLTGSRTAHCAAGALQILGPNLHVAASCALRVRSRKGSRGTLRVTQPREQTLGQR